MVTIKELIDKTKKENCDLLRLVNSSFEHLKKYYYTKINEEKVKPGIFNSIFNVKIRTSSINELVIKYVVDKNKIRVSVNFEIGGDIGHEGGCSFVKDSVCTSVNADFSYEDIEALEDGKDSKNIKKFIFDMIYTGKDYEIHGPNHLNISNKEYDPSKVADAASNKLDANFDKMLKETK